MNKIDDYIEAGKEDVEEKTFWRLYDSKCSRVKQRLAENPSTPKELLKILFKDDNPEVRAALAGNKAVDLELLELLCDDPDINVKLSLAAEPNLPPYLLDKLSKDENPYVRDMAELTLEIVMLEDTLKSIGFEYEEGNTARLGELFLYSAVITEQILENLLEKSLSQKKHLGHILIQELSINLSLVVKALQLQSKVRKGKISLEQAVDILKNKVQNLRNIA